MSDLALACPPIAKSSGRQVIDQQVRPKYNQNGLNSFCPSNAPQQTWFLVGDLPGRVVRRFDLECTSWNWARNLAPSSAAARSNCTRYGQLPAVLRFAKEAQTYLDAQTSATRKLALHGLGQCAVQSGKSST